MSNRLPILAAEIRAAHLGVIDAAKTAAERAIEAGRALLEAKALVPHGGWLLWLKDHCQLAERTSQLYMRIAESGLESATVADMGLKAAARSFLIEDPNKHIWDGIDAPEMRRWRLFVIFGAHPSHVEWLLRNGFHNINEWLGPEGTKYRRMWRINEPSAEFLAAWERFKAEHAETPDDVIEADAHRAADARYEHDQKPAPRRKRKRRERAA